MKFSNPIKISSLILGIFLISACTSKATTEKIPNKKETTYEQYANINKTIISNNSYALYEACKPYKEYIQEQAIKRNMPKEIYAIPAIESGCKENIISNNQINSGMWQLTNNMVKTKIFSSESNKDIMSDWKKSTDFALDYIKYNAENNFDNNYELAIISYNAGTAKVKKAIENNNTTDASIIIKDKSIFKEETILYFNKYISYSKEFAILEKNKNL